VRRKREPALRRNLAALFHGAAVDRHGSARAGRLGFVLLAAGGVATLAANSLGLLLASRALAGVGVGMVLLATLKLLVRYAVLLPPGQRLIGRRADRARRNRQRG
jgi:MFS family permease